MLNLTAVLYIPASPYNRISIGQLTSEPGGHWYLRLGNFGALGLQGIDIVKNGGWRVGNVEGVVAKGISWITACGSEESRG